MHATLDRPDPPPAEGEPLPPFHHWIYFLAAPPLRELGRDGHAAVGGFLPDTGLPRRMWASGRLSFHAPLPLGADASRVSTVANVAAKSGRSGRLCFVTVRHELHGPDGRAVTEDQELVFREDPGPDAPAPAPPEARTDETVRRARSCGPTMLFRYSALTFNGHRIHYDLPYCREVEGYPGLIVHGPLIATLLLELHRDAFARPLAAFAFRASAPLFHHETFELCARPTAEGAELWARGPDGRLAMSASATHAD